MALLALLWALGLSTRAMAFFLERLEVHISATTVWRDVLLLLWEVKGEASEEAGALCGAGGLLGDAA